MRERWWRDYARRAAELVIIVVAKLAREAAAEPSQRVACGA